VFDAMMNTGLVKYMIARRLSFSGSGKPIRERFIVVREHLPDHKRRFSDQAIQEARSSLG
jgi:hypothetical protein